MTKDYANRTTSPLPKTRSKGKFLILAILSLAIIMAATLYIVHYQKTWLHQHQRKQQNIVSIKKEKQEKKHKETDFDFYKLLPANTSISNNDLKS